MIKKVYFVKIYGMINKIENKGKTLPSWWYCFFH